MMDLEKLLSKMAEDDFAPVIEEENDKKMRKFADLSSYRT